MGKRKITTLNIDEKVLNKAKKEIPNISLFIENCLKAYLGLDGCDFNISSIDNELELMKQSNLNIHLLSSMEETNNVVKTQDTQEINSAWLKVWGEYRTHEIYDNTDLDKLSKLSGYSPNQLVDMMDYLLLNCDRKQLLKCETFEGAVQNSSGEDTR